MVKSGLAILEEAADYVKAHAGANSYQSLYFSRSGRDRQVDYGIYFNNGIKFVFTYCSQEIPKLDELWEDFNGLWKEGERLAIVKENNMAIVRSVVLAQHGVKERLSKRNWVQMDPSQITVDMYNLLLKNVPKDKILGFGREYDVKIPGDEMNEYNILVAKLLEKGPVMEKVREADNLTFQGVFKHEDPFLYSYKISGGMMRLEFPCGFCQTPPIIGDIHINFGRTKFVGLDLDEMKSLLPATVITSETIIHIIDDLEELLNHYNEINKENYRRYVDGLPPGSSGRYIEARKQDGT